MSPSDVAVTVLCAVLALASGQTRRLTFNGVDYSSQELRLNNNVKIQAFFGIPYARQPFGRFRFTRPEPLTKLNDWQLTDDELRRHYKTPPTQARSCPQIDPFGGNFDSSQSIEDCLRVDLYILDEVFQEQRSYDRKYGMGILVEGFEFKSSVASHLDLAGGGFKGQSDVGVLAVVHYRLGALGFLTTEDDEGPANLGLWDQSEALRFLKEHALNGNIPQVDPQRISLLGFGSGGVSASIHMLNPLNKAMFSSALVSGGSALGPDASIRDARDRAFEFGQHVGCTSSSPRKLINCLRYVDLQKLVTTGNEANFLFGPVVDVNHTRDVTKAYIMDHPQRLMERENFESIRSVLYGFPEHAASLRYYTQALARAAPLNGRTTAPPDNSIDERIKYYLSPFQSHGDTSRALAASVKFLYFRNYTDETLMSNQTLFDSLMIDALTDYLSVGPVISAAHLHASKKLNEQRSGVFIYYRDSEPELATFSSKLPVMSSASVKYGTTMDDLLQFVGVKGIVPSDQGSEDRLARVWTVVLQDLFGKVETSARDIAGIQDYRPISRSEVFYITALRGKGSPQASTMKYREPNRIFWSKYVPTIGTILDDISRMSRDRNDNAKLYWRTTLGTAIPLGLLVIVCLCLGALLWKAQRSASSNLTKVQFHKVSTNDP
ncbi:cholinesterase [Galendromus occidentalis]|uniref:Cholinesterase n=1 Tax=Galendromus occidentalis TaxID=34638 RepID=A0AAJ6W0J9_9ACAR|nr:cholinesterase [Galendromus occidentalis]